MILLVMATTYPDAARVSDRPSLIRVSLPPPSTRAEVSFRILGPFSAAPSRLESVHTLLTFGGAALTIAIGLLAWQDLSTIGNAILYLVP